MCVPAIDPCIGLPFLGLSLMSAATTHRAADILRCDVFLSFFPFYVDMRTESAEFKDSAAPKGPKYHPMFSFDADIVLSSRNGVLFSVPSMTLKMTSAWFRTMFTLPQGSPPSSSRSQNSTQQTAADSDTEIIGLDEDTSTLEALFRMICGLEIPTLDMWDAVEPVLYTAEKYDMPGPASIVRALLRTPTLVNAPLRLYCMPRRATLAGRRMSARLRRAHLRSTYTIPCTDHHSSACTRRNSSRSTRSTTNGA